MADDFRAAGRDPVHTAERSAAIRWRKSLGLDRRSSRTFDAKTGGLATESSWLVDWLLAAPDPYARAQDFGSELAQLCSGSADALGRTVRVLTYHSCCAGLQAASPSGTPRVDLILGGIAYGFVNDAQLRFASLLEATQSALVAARQDAQRVVRSSEGRYRVIASQAAEGIVLVDSSSAHIRESNAAFRAMLGYTEEELIGMALFDLVAHDRASVQRNIRRAVSDGMYCIHGRQYRRKDGSLVTVEGSSVALEADVGQLLCIIVRDVTERVRARGELEQARRGLVEAREEERRKVARELHDGAVQELVGLRYRIASARRRAGLASCPVEPLQQIKRAEGELGQVIGQLRALVAELRPTGLEEGGFGSALENYLASHTTAPPHKPAVAVDVGPDDRELPPPVAFCLFRVTQEAIRNSREHAHARTVTVRLRVRAGQAILSVVDDGRGFNPPARLSTLAKANHYGLVGMSERVEQVHGRLRVRSRPGRGTIISARIPLKVSEGMTQDGHSYCCG